MENLEQAPTSYFLEALATEIRNREAGNAGLTAQEVRYIDERLKEAEEDELEEEEEYPF